MSQTEAQFLNRQTTEEGLPEHQVTAEAWLLACGHWGAVFFLGARMFRGSGCEVLEPLVSGCSRFRGLGAG